MGGVYNEAMPASAPMAMKSAVTRSEGMVAGRPMEAKDERSEESDSLSKKKENGSDKGAVTGDESGVALR